MGHTMGEILYQVNTGQRFTGWSPSDLPRPLVALILLNSPNLENLKFWFGRQSWGARCDRSQDVVFFVYVSSSILRLEQHGRVHSHKENIGQKRIEKNTNLANVTCLIRYNQIINWNKIKKKQFGFMIKFITIITKFFSENELISYNPNWRIRLFCYGQCYERRYVHSPN